MWSAGWIRHDVAISGTGYVSDAIRTQDGGGPSFAEHKTGLLKTSFPANISCMSTVELAVSKVKKLSARQARELLGWLTARQPNGTSLKQPARTSRRKTTARRSMQKLRAWQDSVRGTTDWQPPRMPDDLVKPIRL
jgi:hypothetical protein